jgi:hypothetical protein
MECFSCRDQRSMYQVDDYGRRGKFPNTLDALIEQYTMANERQKEAEATSKTVGLDRSDWP